MENKFIIIIPVYNAEQYIEKCMNSVLMQDYNNYNIIVIDDNSTDSTYKKLSYLHNKYDFELIKNDVRLNTPLANFVKGINLYSDDKEDIIVMVDGDDFLYNDKVLSYLNDVYQDDNIYMTYGQFIPLSGSYGKYCKDILNFRTYRKSGNWFAGHLRTFKNKLWKLIDDKDLRNENGEYFKVASDASYIYPLLELCGKNHVKFIDDILYVYNDLNPINDMKINTIEQLKTSKYIRDKPLYDELKNKI